jgi:hypothetical protein
LPPPPCFAVDGGTLTPHGAALAEAQRAQPQVDLLEIIRTARAYIGILEAETVDKVAKEFLGSLYNKMTEAIKPILP